MLCNSITLWRRALGGKGAHRKGAALILLALMRMDGRRCLEVTLPAKKACQGIFIAREPFMGHLRPGGGKGLVQGNQDYARQDVIGILLNGFSQVKDYFQRRQSNADHPSFFWIPCKTVLPVRLSDSGLITACCFAGNRKPFGHPSGPMRSAGSI